MSKVLYGDNEAEYLNVYYSSAIALMRDQEDKYREYLQR